jgi:hypothetical protein
MNRFTILAFALVLPAVLAAQQPAQPMTDPIVTPFKQTGGNYARLLMQAFDSIPASKYGYKPTPAQLTIGQIAAHLEGANYQLCTLMGGPARTMTARDSMPDSVKVTWGRDSLNARLKASFAYCNQAMATVTDANIGDMLTVGPPGSTRTAPRSRFVLIFVTDMVDHYSQLANYMRLNGILPPSALPRPPRPGN